MRWAGKLFGGSTAKPKSKAAARRVAVLGAGPIGMEAGLLSLNAGFKTTIYDRGDIGENLRQWGHVKLFSPFGLNATTAGLEAIRKEHKDLELPGPGDFISGNDFRDLYLTPLSLTPGLCDALKLKTEVLSIGRSGFLKEDPADDPRRASAPFRLLVRDEKKAERFEEADILLDCTGTFGRHRWAGNGGVPALNERISEAAICYGLEDVLGSRKAHFAGRSILVIGGGYSAATTVCNLMTLAEDNSATWVFWLTRDAKSTPLPRIPGDPFRERDRLAAKANSLAARGDGNLEYHPNTLVEEITSHGPDKGFRVVAKAAGQEKVWEVDRVIANVGYRANADLASELHPNEPNYFVLGAKAAVRDRGFLLKDGYAELERVFAQLCGNAEVRAAG